MLGGAPAALIAGEDRTASAGGRAPDWLNVSSDGEAGRGGGGRGVDEGLGRRTEAAAIEVARGLPHEALAFLVVAILTGTFLLHLTFRRVFRSLQQTVVLFILGVSFSMCVQGFDLEEKLGSLGRSYNMWMLIEPHLILFTLLPPLLAGDAMTIDTHLARRVARQCLYLAGPGVLFNAVLAATFLYFYLPYDWPFLLCFTLGAILSATDPVAVVALLKDLGASPMLTVQIQGESLLNDGTAIVLFTITYNMLRGVEYGNGDIIVFVVKTSVYAWLLGTAIGVFFFLWLRMANNKLDHNSCLIQVSLTIACAYTSFFVAEGVFHISGVLSTVAASLVLAHRMWAEVVNRKTMHTVWHMFEYLGNTTIFFLAGALTGNIMARIPFMDYLHLLSIYIALVVIRGVLIFSSRPLFKMMSPDRQPVTLPDALVMTWGGLRGAVGLALAIQVSVERAGGALSDTKADKVLFYVGGVALLTLAINASTSPALLRRLGLAQTPEVKKRIMRMLHMQLLDHLKEQDCADNVRGIVANMLNDIGDRLGDDKSSGDVAPSFMPQRTTRGTMHFLNKARFGDDAAVPRPKALVAELERAAARFARAPLRQRELLTRHLVTKPMFETIDRLRETVLSVDVADPHLQRAVNEAFLSLVRAEYWKNIERGELRADDGQNLVMSVTNALSGSCYTLLDFEQICTDIRWPSSDDRLLGNSSRGSVASTKGPKVVFNFESHHVTLGLKATGCSAGMRCVVDSAPFHVVVVLAIFASSFAVFSMDVDASTYSQAQLQLEAAFVAFFGLESLARMLAYRHAFWRDGWNLFDLALVLVGIVGLVLAVTLDTGRQDMPAWEAQVLRSLPLFRKLPAVRVVKLLRAGHNMGETIMGKQSRSQNATHVAKFEILFHFIRAHLLAQKDLMRFLGCSGGDMVRAESADDDGLAEVALCLAMSQIEVLDAMTVCAYEEDFSESWMLEEQRACKDSIAVAAKLESFVESARQGGVLTSSEAGELVHAMADHMKQLRRRIGSMHQGRATQGPQYIKKADDESIEVVSEGASVSSSSSMIVGRRQGEDEGKGVGSDLSSGAPPSQERKSQIVGPVILGSHIADAPDTASKGVAARGSAGVPRAGGVDTDLSSIGEDSHMELGPRLLLGAGSPGERRRQVSGGASDANTSRRSRSRRPRSKSSGDSRRSSRPPLDMCSCGDLEAPRQEVKRLSIDTEQPGEVEGLRWQAGSAAGAWVGAIGPELQARAAVLRRPGEPSVVPGDRLSRVNRQDVSRMSRQEIEQIWEEAIQESRFLHLEFAAGPAAAAPPAS